MKRKVCDQCGNDMKLRTGRDGKFWGCLGYPECRNTIDPLELSSDDEFSAILDQYKNDACALLRERMMVELYSIANDGVQVTVTDGHLDLLIENAVARASVSVRDLKADINALATCVRWLSRTLDETQRLCYAAMGKLRSHIVENPPIEPPDRPVASRIPIELSDIAHRLTITGAQVGVYFLVRDLSVVYVGRSVDVKNRVAAHAREGKEFNDVLVLPCQRDVLGVLEEEWIDRLKPEYNLKMPSAARLALVRSAATA